MRRFASFGRSSGETSPVVIIFCTSGEEKCGNTPSMETSRALVPVLRSHLVPGVRGIDAAQVLDDEGCFTLSGLGLDYNSLFSTTIFQ
ncbi:MAG: hypothetical protein ACE5D4_01715 [Thermodesulfobacteriota bacterium]